MTATLGSGIEEMFTSGDPHWRERSLCKQSESSIFFPVERRVVDGEEIDEEPPYPTPEARALCQRCPVRPECLKYALDERIPYGTFAGMSGYQRSLITKKVSRKRCPGCGSEEIHVREKNEICLSCAISWDSGATDVDDE